MAEAPEGKYLVDSYLDWCQAQDVPIIEDFGIDLLAADTRPWARFGIDGAIAHLKGRCDFLSIFLFEIPPGGKSEAIRHLYEEVVYVLAGHGTTQVECADGTSHSFEWGPKSLFALPLNARYRHFNGSGTEPARLAATNDCRYMMNLYRNEGFIFDNPCAFPERSGQADYFAGQGTFVPLRPGRHQWETNFVPDLAAFELKEWAARGAGSTSIRFILAESSLGVHASEMPVGTYKKGHRHPPGYCVYAVTGAGYSLLWYEGDEDFERTDWRHGVVYAPPDMMFHQHFNSGTEPARYLAVQMGGVRYPMFQEKHRIFDGAVDTSLADGGNQIEYADQDQRIHALFLDEIGKNGVQSAMGKFIDESNSKRSA